MRTATVSLEGGHDGAAARLAEAVAQGARRVVLAVRGEPDTAALADLLREARRRGPQVELVLDHDGPPFRSEDARQLATAGLGAARVRARGPEPLRPLGRALAIWRDAGVAVEAAGVLLRSSAAWLPAIPSVLAAHGARSLEVAVPARGPDAGELLSYAEAAPVLAAIERAAREAGVPVRLAPGEGPPPCAIPRHAAMAQIFALSPGGGRREGFTRVAACETCVVADRCPGFARDALARGEGVDVAPVHEERVKRRLTLATDVRGQIARELVTRNRRNDPDLGLVEERIVRIQFACNQACRFCFVSTHLPAPDDGDVRAAILEAGRAGARIAISGGEPTLHPDLAAWIRLAKRVSRHPVELQTNAVRLADAGLVRELVEAGLDEAFVSLHGATAETSDAITDAPGTFARTVIGIDHLHASPIHVSLNFVINARNRHEILPWMRLVADRWPKVHHVTYSFVAPSSDLVPRDRDLIPRYSEVLPALAEALAHAQERRVRVGGFHSMCGLPLCLVPGEIGRYLAAEAIPEDFAEGEFLQPEACTGCAARTKCYGVRRGYAALHGTGELRPLAGAIS